jgi:protein-tyrosine phosphatase
VATSRIDKIRLITPLIATINLQVAAFTKESRFYAFSRTTPKAALQNNSSVLDSPVSTCLTLPVHRLTQSHPLPLRFIRIMYDDEESGISEIAPRLYLGACIDAYDLKLVQRLGITHFLAVGEELDEKFPPSLRIPIKDSFCTDLLSILDEAVDYIDTVLAQPANILLVHCFFGVSRSASVIIAWWMRTKKIKEFEVALSEIRIIRPCVKPNMGFAHQLGLWGMWGWTVDMESEEYKLVSSGERYRDYVWAHRATFSKRIQVSDPFGTLHWG